jgi:hypothetical protein
VALLKALYPLEEFFQTVQGYCDLLVNLSLVIKMGRKVNKCAIYLYNIPEDETVPKFMSTAWSYDARGPVTGEIAVVVMQRDSQDQLLCYQVPDLLQHEAPQYIKDILAPRKYLGVPSNAQLDERLGREKNLNKLQQRIGVVATKTDSVNEAKVAHNMLVCQVATFSPICIPMSLQDCIQIDKCLLKSYQYRLRFMPFDAKHSIFIAEKRRGLGLRSFTREYIGALLRDIEVYITCENSLPAHALMASIEGAAQQNLWIYDQNNMLPALPNFVQQVKRYQISKKKTIYYADTFESPALEETSFNHTHIMAQAITSVSTLGFMLRDLDEELCARIVEEHLLGDQLARSVGDPNTPGRAKLGAFIGEGCKRFYRYSIIGHVYLFLKALIDDTSRNIMTMHRTGLNAILSDKLSRPGIYKEANLFPKEISPIRLC